MYLGRDGEDSIKKKRRRNDSAVLPWLLMHWAGDCHSGFPVLASWD